MKIIKTGKIPDKDKPLQFTCINCGCKFEATRTEYKIVKIESDLIESCEVRCPICNHLVIKMNKVKHKF